MDIIEIEKLYKELLEDPEFEKLDLHLNKPNIFEILGYKNKEHKHSNMLCWLLNPLANHSFGSYFLRNFLSEILIDPRANNLSIVDIFSLNLNNAKIRREWHNIDILIELENNVIAIENKIDADEETTQLKRYKSIIDDHFPDSNKVFVYLTPFGDESTRNDDYVNVSYSPILRILENLVNINTQNINPTILVYINDYINILKFKIMETSPIITHAQKIYQNHKELFDFIFQNKPDAKNIFLSKIADKLRSNGYVVDAVKPQAIHFLTIELSNLIPKGFTTESQNTKSFHFQVSFPEKKNEEIKVNTILYATDKEIFEILKPILDDLEGKPNKSLKYLTYQNKSLKLKGNVFDNNYEVYMDDDIDKIIETAKGITTKIVTEILKVENQIKIINRNRGTIKS